MKWIYLSYQCQRRIFLDWKYEKSFFFHPVESFPFGNLLIMFSFPLDETCIAGCHVLRGQCKKSTLICDIELDWKSFGSHSMPIPMCGNKCLNTLMMNRVLYTIVTWWITHQWYFTSLGSYCKLIKFSFKLLRIHINTHITASSNNISWRTYFFFLGSNLNSVET